MSTTTLGSSRKGAKTCRTKRKLSQITAILVKKCIYRAPYYSKEHISVTSQHLGANFEEILQLVLVLKRIK